jgi:aryl-alcohol dehydrogenase-like predicted oxidoreductase
VLEQRHIGDLQVSVIGLGTVKFGRNTDVKYPQPFALPSMTTLENLLGVASDLGINLIDTAPAYGESESRVGQLISGHRERWVLATKVGEFYDGKSQFNFSPDAITRSVESSLRRLRTDYLDIVLLHCDDDDESTLRQGPVIEALTSMKQRGLIRQVGASTKTVAGGLLALDMLDLAMVTFNMTDQSQQPVLDYASKLGKSVIIKKALSSGHAVEVGKSLKHALHQAAVASVIVGTINEEHLRYNLSQI